MKTQMTPERRAELTAAAAHSASTITAEPMRSLTQAIQHTPGPWHIENETDTGSLLRTWVLSQLGEPVVTFAFSQEHKDNEPEQFATAQANARLIAAAPELLAALEALLHVAYYNRQDGQPVDAIIQARAAIARATQS